MKKYFIAVLLFLGSNPLFSAQTVQPALSARSFYLNQPFQVQVNLPEEASVESLPSSKSYQAQFLGMTTQVLRNISIINGKINRQSETQYLYTFQITPLKKGKISIGSFTLKSARETYSTEAFVIQTSEQSAPQSLNQREMVRLFLNIHYPRTEIIKNKACIIEARVYCDNRDYINNAFQESQKLISQKSVVYDISESLADEQISQTNISGIKLFYRVVKRYVLFPVDSGELVVQPPVINAITPYGIQPLQEENFILKVRDGGSGPGLTYIGQLQAELENYDLPVRAGDHMEFKVLLKGDGNLKILGHPYGGIQSPDLFISQPKVDFKFDSWANGKAYFSQVLTYRITTQRPGQVTVPGVDIRYQDDRLSPKTASLPSFTISVLDGIQGSNGNVVLPPMAKTDTRTVLHWNSPLFIILTLLFLILPAGSAFYGRFRLRLETDKDFARLHSADRHIEKVFKLARESQARADWKQFYHLLYTQVLNYISSKYTLAPGLKLTEVMQALKSQGIKKDELDILLRDLKNWSSMAYSPLLSGDNAEADLQEAMRLVRQLH